MPLPDERPRASVANLIGRFERSAQRRASQTDLNAAAQQSAGLPTRPIRVINRDPPPKSPVNEGPIWLKNRVAKLKSNAEVAQPLEGAPSTPVVSIPQLDPSLAAKSAPNSAEAPATAVESPKTPKTPKTPNVEPAPPAEPEPTKPPEKPVPQQPALAKAGSSNTSAKPNTRSAFTPSANRTARTDVSASLKASRSTSALKPLVNPPSAFKPNASPSPAPAKPSPNPATPSGSPERAPISSSKSASAVRKPRVLPSASLTARATTPQPRTVSGPARPKTPSALHAPTASSLAKSKSPTPSPQKTQPKPAVPALPGKAKVTTPLRANTTSPTPSASRKQPLPPKGSAAQTSGALQAPKKPLLLSGKGSKPAVKSEVQSDLPKLAAVTSGQAEAPNGVPQPVAGHVSPVPVEHAIEAYATVAGEDHVIHSEHGHAETGSDAAGDSGKENERPELAMLVSMLEGAPRIRDPDTNGDVVDLGDPVASVFGN